MTSINVCGKMALVAQRNPTAAEMGRKGGQARVPKGTAMLSPTKRRALAKKAARARWGKR